jgi:hypothetical protein
LRGETVIAGVANMFSKDQIDLFLSIRPSGIAVGEEGYIMDPIVPEGKVDIERIRQMLALTLEQRVHWHEYWRKIVRDCEQRGVSIEETVYGRSESHLRRNDPT